MKEYLEKFLNLFSEGVAKMQDGKEDEALEKMEEASKMAPDLIKKSEETKEVDLKKFFESEDGKETLKKYADVYFSGTDLKDIISQLKEGQEELSKKVEKLEKEKKEDDETIEKALNEQGEEIDEIKKTLETAVSKID